MEMVASSVLAVLLVTSLIVQAIVHFVVSTTITVGHAEDLTIVLLVLQDMSLLVGNVLAINLMHQLEIVWCVEQEIQITVKLVFLDLLLMEMAAATWVVLLATVMMLDYKNVCAIMVLTTLMENVTLVLILIVIPVLFLVAFIATKVIIWVEVPVNLVLLTVLLV